MISNNSISADSKCSPSSITIEKIKARTELLYGERAEECLQGILQTIRKYPRSDSAAKWSERDIVLITYGDQIQDDRSASLAVLRDFLLAHQLDAVINTVHLLPFCPYS